MIEEGGVLGVSGEYGTWNVLFIKLRVKWKEYTLTKEYVDKVTR